MDNEAGGFNVFVEARSARACAYERKHPGQDALPTSQRKCFGPWISISSALPGNDEPSAGPGSEGHDKLSAYWSLEDSCHASMGGVGAFKTGKGAYQGAHFRFHWEEELPQ
jgi:hypothetical protein